MIVALGWVTLALAALQLLGLFVNLARSIKILGEAIRAVGPLTRPDRVDKVIASIVRSAVIGLLAVTIVTLAGLTLIGVLS